MINNHDNDDHDNDNHDDDDHDNDIMMMMIMIMIIMMIMIMIMIIMMMMMISKWWFPLFNPDTFDGEVHTRTGSFYDDDVDDAGDRLLVIITMMIEIIEMIISKWLSSWRRLCLEDPLMMMMLILLVIIIMIFS